MDQLKKNFEDGVPKLEVSRARPVLALEIPCWNHVVATPNLGLLCRVNLKARDCHLCIMLLHVARGQEVWFAKIPTANYIPRFPLRLHRWAMVSGIALA